MSFLKAANTSSFITPGQGDAPGAYQALRLPTLSPLHDLPSNHLQHPIQVFIDIRIQDLHELDPERLNELLALGVVFSCPPPGSGSPRPAQFPA